jgi:hypothetical protein
MTFLWGFVVILYLPDGPHNAKMLTEYERMVAVWRVSKNQMGIKHHTLLPAQIKEAFIDPKTWLVLLMGACTGLLNGAVANFASAIIKGFGFDALKTTLLQTPGGAFELFGCMIFGWVATKPNLLGATVIGECLGLHLETSYADIFALFSCMPARPCRFDRSIKDQHRTPICPGGLYMAAECSGFTDYPRLDGPGSQRRWSHEEDYRPWASVRVSSILVKWLSPSRTDCS